MALDVEVLNLDSSSMRQLERESGGDAERIKDRIGRIVRERGKMHNPVTRSGGILLGRVSEVGPDFPIRDFSVGDLVCPSVSLSLIPLVLSAIHEVNTDTDQVRVQGKAILFETAVFSRVPTDLSLDVMIGVVDVCGAPARTYQLVRPGTTVGIFGCGKAGLLSAFAAREKLGHSGKLIMLDISPEACAATAALGVANEVICVDLQDSTTTYDRIRAATRGQLLDVAISVTSAPETECAAILSTRQRGTLLLFGMANSFQVAALSADGAGKDIDMLVGIGAAEGCIEMALDLVRRNPDLLAELERRYAR
ncbi:hypothetical protein [Mesorhizobium sp.]|uniref:hypothetical protein n=1 Tax=Mesorhizobium sp. TaxID=1871066 RepID=UPI000FE8CD7D|nr:hypothetical protein [Mesorhizobium sp.]RWD41528.1 MAG: L-erythro-3,5-diaminohexanoate dehydrogenase [Mesorhizobium sp.]